MEVRQPCRELWAADSGWMQDGNCERVSRCPRADKHKAKKPSGSSRPTRTSLNILLTMALLSSAPGAAEGGIFKSKVTIKDDDNDTNTASTGYRSFVWSPA